eukprot:g2614.t1
MRTGVFAPDAGALACTRRGDEGAEILNDYAKNAAFPFEQLSGRSDFLTKLLTAKSTGEQGVTSSLRSERDAYALLRLLPPAHAVPLISAFLSEVVQRDALSYEKVSDGKGLEECCVEIARHTVDAEEKYFGAASSGLHAQEQADERYCISEAELVDQQEAGSSGSAPKKSKAERVSALKERYLAQAREIADRTTNNTSSSSASLQLDRGKEELEKFLKLCVARANVPLIRAGILPMIEAVAYYGMAADHSALQHPAQHQMRVDSSVSTRSGARNKKAPVGGCFVSLYSDFVSDHVDALAPSDCARFITALAKPVFSTDEFWMFMLAKRTQDCITEFSGLQLVSIAYSFADQYLEDDDFMRVLVDELLFCATDPESRSATSTDTKFATLTVYQKTAMLWSCAKLRYRDEELARAVVAEVAENLQRHTLQENGSASAPQHRQQLLHSHYRQFVYALGFLDLLDLVADVSGGVENELIKNLARQVRRAASAKDEEDEWAHTSAATSLYLFPANARTRKDFLAPATAATSSGRERVREAGPSPTAHPAFASGKLEQGTISTSVMTSERGEGGHPPAHLRPFFMLLASSLNMLSVNRQFFASKRPSLASRRVKLILSCFLSGMLGPVTDFPLSVLKQLSKCGSALDGLKTGGHETDSSGFHLEVATVLDQLRVAYGLEKAAAPFVLDLLLTQSQPFFKQLAAAGAVGEERAEGEHREKEKRLAYVFGG